MTDLIVVPKPNEWLRLKSLVLDSVSSPITKRVYNLGLDEFFAWYSQEPRAGLSKATVSAWRLALEARGLGSVSINVRRFIARDSRRGSIQGRNHSAVASVAQRTRRTPSGSPTQSF